MEHPSELVGKTYFIRTFGCQMNLHDSERVSGVLDECGWVDIVTVVAEEGNEASTARVTRISSGAARSSE